MATFIPIVTLVTEVVSLDADLQAALNAELETELAFYPPKRLGEMLEWLAAYDHASWDQWAEIERIKTRVSGDGHFVIGQGGFRFTDKATALLFKLTFGGK